MLDTDENQDLTDDQLSPAHRSQGTEIEESEDLSPDNIAQMEDDASNVENVEAGKPEEDEDDAVNRRMQDFYSEDSQGSKKKSRLFSKGSRSRKLGVAASAVGIPSLLAGIAFLPGLLGLFKMQNFYENINASSFLRLNSAFDNRSDKWIKAYIKLRLTEIDGDVAPGQDTLYFRADKVDTNSPIRDWYRTMRTSKFEQELFEREGISFKSGMKKDANGRVSFGLAVVTIRDTPINYSYGDVGTSFDLADTRASTNVMNRIGPDLERFVQIELLEGPGGSKRARGVIKDAVNRNTNSWRVFQRRHIRKSIANMTGVRNWRLFETSRDRLDAKRTALYNKIMIAVLPENRTGKFIACLFGAGSCPSTTDPSSKESKVGAELTDGSNIIDGENPDDLNEDGTPVVGDDLDTPKSPTEIAGAIAPEQKLGNTIKDYIKKYLGNPYTKVWYYLKTIAQIHDTLSNNKLGKLVVQARRAQYMTAYATWAIAVSQMKSGDIMGTEGQEGNTQVLGDEGQINEYMNYFNNAERSEAWSLFGGGEKSSGSTVSAEGEDLGRTAYCDLDRKTQRAQPVYYRCADDAISGGRADSIAEDYNNGVGRLLGPIADAVNAVRKSFLGDALDFALGAADKLVETVVGPVLDWVLDTTGGGKAIEDIVTTGLVEAIEYVGAGAKYDPTHAGQLNYMMMGASATAEATARQNGAALTSSLVGLKDYSNNMAVNWKNEKQESMSTFEKYASLSNPKSFASTSLMALSTTSPSSIIKSSVNPAQGLDNYAGALNGRVFAATETDSHSVSEWSGVDSYDFPQQCIDLDPLEPDYFQQATNAPDGVARDMATLGDSEVFWAAVYDNFSGTMTEKEIQAESVYNCILLDRSIMGGMGYAYGYTNDGGYSDSGGTAVTTPTPTTPTGPNYVDPSPYIPDCSVNGGRAAIACTAISQLLGIAYGPGASITNPNPGFLDCSTFTGSAIYRTFGVTINRCSTGYLTDPNFIKIDVRSIQPGDFVGKGTGCFASGGGGHIALVVSYDPVTKILITAETDGKANPSRIETSKGLAVDGRRGTYIWAVRYVGNMSRKPN